MTEQGTFGPVVRGEAAAWRALPYPGVSVKVLRNDKDTGDGAFLLKFDAGAWFPAHHHPGGEHVFVLEGDLLIGRDRLTAGDYLYTPPNGTHAASSEGGCVFITTLPKPIEILGD